MDRPFLSQQLLTHYSAGCFTCGASCGARNAQAWAHNHVQKTGHTVELSLGWNVGPPRQALSQGGRDG